MLFDLSNLIPEWSINILVIATTLFFFWWIVLRNKKQVPWAIRPIYADSVKKEISKI
jgi:type II secretory pathway component PulF